MANIQSIMTLPYFIAAIVVGLIVLTWSTDRFIGAAAAVAQRLGVSTFFIGLTVVAFGTSAPEMVVSLFAALEGAPGIAIGNVFGSNIANIGLVLGLTALIKPIPFGPGILRRELLFLVVLTVVVGGMVMDYQLSLGDSVILLALLSLFLVLLTQWQNPEDDLEDLDSDGQFGWQLFWLVVGLALLLASSRALVWGAVGVAEYWGVNETIIGLTIVAIGTSLPELATTVGSALKNKPGLAFGNVIGSNALNLLVVLPIPGLFGMVALPPELVDRDFLVMLGITLAFVALSLIFRPKVNRFSGVVLLGSYLAYIGYLVVLVV